MDININELDARLRESYVNEEVKGAIIRREESLSVAKRKKSLLLISYDITNDLLEEEVSLDVDERRDLLRNILDDIGATMLTFSNYMYPTKLTAQEFYSIIENHVLVGYDRVWVINLCQDYDGTGETGTRTFLNANLPFKS